MRPVEAWQRAFVLLADLGPVGAGEKIIAGVESTPADRMDLAKEWDDIAECLFAIDGPSTMH